MSAERKSHVAKTRIEREQYNKTVVQAPDATAGSVAADDYDATDLATSARTQPTGATLTPRYVSGGAFKKFVREHWFDVILVGLLAWAAGSLVGLNREMGEVRGELRGIDNEQTRAQARADRLEQRVDALVDRRRK